MYGRHTKLRHLLSVASATVCACLIAAGCNNPAGGSTGRTERVLTPLEVAKIKPEPDVINISVLRSANSPWLWSRDRTRAEGVRVGALYLIGPDGKGVFGDGVIRPQLYVIERDTDGRGKPVLLKEWSFDVEEAILLRAKVKRSLGWGYGLPPLQWGDVDLGGREIMYVITFERRDGLAVSSSEHCVRVPKGAP